MRETQSLAQTDAATFVDSARALDLTLDEEIISKMGEWAKASDCQQVCPADCYNGSRQVSFGSVVSAQFRAETTSGALGWLSAFSSLQLPSQYAEHLLGSVCITQ